MWAPVLAWQATHGWPQLELAREIRAEFGAADQRIIFAAEQFVPFGLVGGYLWVTGLVQLWRGRSEPVFRVLAWAWLVLLAVFVVSAGQRYYLAPIHPALIAAGAVAVERSHPGPALTAALAVATSALLLPAVLPVLPATTPASSPWNTLAEQQREGRLAQVRRPGGRRLPLGAGGPPPGDRHLHRQLRRGGGDRRVRPRPGAAARVQRDQRVRPVGRAPAAPRDVPVVVVSEDGGPDPRVFTGCGAGTRVRGPVPNEETQRAAVHVCSGVTGSWAAVWPRLVHLSN
jgi:hypothetical protein